MSELEKLIHSSYSDLFVIDGEGTIYDDPGQMTHLLSPRIIDEITLLAIDIPDLFNAMNYTKTRTGAATLFRSLIEPLDSLDLIQEKQSSIKELEKDGRKRGALIGYLNSLAEREQYMHRSLFECMYCRREPYNLRFIDQYKLYREFRKFFEDMVDGVKHFPSIESPYLRGLIEDIQSIDEKRVFDLIKGPIYKTFEGIKTKKEVRIYTPRIKFTLRSFKPTLAIPYVIALLLTYFESMRFLGPMAAFSYIPIMYGYPESFDRKHFILPLMETYKEDPNIRRGIDALGMIDELLSFYEYSKAMGEYMVLPTITRSSEHYFIAKNIKNPILAKGNPNYVLNDLNIQGEKLTIITGPNSGGKTIYSKTIAQMQLLAQIGCYVPAEEAELCITDRILYQAPMSDSIRDVEGRFGTELQRTRDIFFKATPRSLIILDELAEATTYEEKTEISYIILNGFNKIGSTTILVTHNHELASRFYEEGKSQNLQVEFRNEKPTYRVIPGISKESHAELIAGKVGFSPHDIEAYLKRKGYLQ